MKKDTAYFKDALTKELKTLEDELNSIARINPLNKNDWEAKRDPMDIDPADENVVADGLDAYEENVAILAKLEPRYNEVKAALDRIEKGNYGTCHICGKAIEEDRLEANPAATTCKEHMQ